MKAASCGEESSSPAKKEKWNPKSGWFEEHRIIYEHQGLRYPPNLEAESSDVLIDYSFIPPGRMREAAYFYCTAFPVTDDEIGRWHFIDINPTLSRQLRLGSQVRIMESLEGKQLADPWSKGALLTLTGSSRCCCELFKIMITITTTMMMMMMVMMMMMTMMTFGALRRLCLACIPWCFAASHAAGTSGSTNSN